MVHIYIVPNIRESGASPLLSRLATFQGFPNIVPSGLIAEIPITPCRTFRLRLVYNLLLLQK